MPGKTIIIRLCADVLGKNISNDTRRYIVVQTLIEMLKSVSKVTVKEMAVLIHRKGFSKLPGSGFMALSYRPEISG